MGLNKQVTKVGTEVNGRRDWHNLANIQFRRPNTKSHSLLYCSYTWTFPQNLSPVLYVRLAAKAGKWMQHPNGIQLSNVVIDRLDSAIVINLCLTRSRQISHGRQLGHWYTGNPVFSFFVNSVCSVLISVLVMCDLHSWLSSDFRRRRKDLRCVFWWISYWMACDSKGQI